MARYIDAEKLIEHIKNMPWKMDSASEITKFIFILTVEEAPTADVAPKSEVAREIFEEMIGLLSMRMGIKEVIAELKKKYTEG